MDGKNFFLWLQGLALCVLPIALGNWWPLRIYLMITLLIMIIDFIIFYRKERAKEREQEHQKEWEKKFEAAEGELENYEEETKPKTIENKENKSK